MSSFFHVNSEQIVSDGGGETRLSRDCRPSAARLAAKRKTFQAKTDFRKGQNQNDETCLRLAVPHDDARLAAQDVALGTFFTNQETQMEPIH